MQLPLIYKYRIYPNSKQKILLQKQFGCGRFVWNSLLRHMEDLGHFLSYYEMSKYLIHVLKPKFEWLSEVSTASLQVSLLNLQIAIRASIRKNAPSNKPRFKKKSSRQSCTFPQYVKVDKENNLLKIQKIRSGIKIILHRDLPDFKSVTIVKESDGSYYACFVAERDVMVENYDSNTKHTGIDLGLKDLITLSTGETVAPPKFFRKSEENIARKNRALSKKTRGSKRWLKCRKRLSKTQSRVRQQRIDFSHKLTTRLANDNDAIAVESIRSKNIAKNHSLAKSVMDASWYTLCNMLMYKMKIKGKSFISCGGLFPSTQLCSSCNNQTGPKGINNLSGRNWTCPICHTDHNRDINAAINIGLEGDRLYHYPKAA